MCIHGTVNVHISANTTKLDYEPPSGQFGTTESMVELLQAGAPLAKAAIEGTDVLTGNYDIFCKLCFPRWIPKAFDTKTIQLLTHGATLDHTYWDIASGYSYVDAASEAGYVTLSYDQLGVGRSDHPDPIQAVQATSQVEVTHALIEKLRGGEIGYRRFDQVVGVGHSAGSTLTQAITVRYPQSFDAVILTGTSTSDASVSLTVAAFNFINANEDQCGRFKRLPPGYLTQQTAAGIQFAFYRWPNFDVHAFRQQVDNKQTNTLGVLFTLGDVVAPAPKFTGPVDVVLGENDLVFCGGDCTQPSNQAAKVQPAFYPAASSGSQYYIAKGSGHAIAAHKSAKDSFDHMIQFLRANGIN